MTKADLAKLAAVEEQALAGRGGAPMPHVPQGEAHPVEAHPIEAQ